jgi:hypothetical protein
MIWLFPHLPLPSELDWWHTGRLRKRDTLLTGEGSGGGGGAKSCATPARKPGNSIIPGKLYIWHTVCFASVLHSKPGFRRRQECMKPSNFFIPTGIVSDPDPYWIRIQSGQCIRIRLCIRNPDPDPGGQKWLKKVEKIKKISCFEVLDVLFGELKASFVTWSSFMEI